MPPTDDVAAQKAAARTLVRSRRRAHIMPEPSDEALLVSRLLALPEVAGLPAGSTVACYVAARHEPRTALLVGALSGRGLRVRSPSSTAQSRSRSRSGRGSASTRSPTRPR